MSDTNRQLFLSRLAKKNVLSKSKMKHFWPVITKIRFNIPDIEEQITVKTVNKSWNISKDGVIDNCKILTGERIELYLNKIDDTLIGKNINFNINLHSINSTNTNSTNIVIKGNCKILSTTNKKLCSFIVPLIPPWSYNTIASKYNINIQNININTYPERCRV